MISKQFVIIGIFILILSLFNGSLIAQKTEKISKEFILLEVDDVLLKELEKILEKEKQCKKYDSILLWSIGTYILEDSTVKLYIELSSTVNKTHNYLGAFYLGNTLFTVSGDFVGKLFMPKEKIKIIVAIVNKNNMGIEMYDFEDYSTWVYLYKDDVLIKSEEYLIYCD